MFRKIIEKILEIIYGNYIIEINEKEKLKQETNQQEDEKNEVEKNHIDDESKKISYVPRKKCHYREISFSENPFSPIGQRPINTKEFTSDRSG